MKKTQIPRILSLLVIFLCVEISLSTAVIGNPLATTQKDLVATNDSSESPIAAICDNIPYTTIQEAITQATPGATIYIKAGIYNEILDITKTITIVGEGKDITSINPTSTKNSYAIRISAEKVTVSDLSIHNQGQGLYTTGIKITASFTTIQNCDISETPVGIALWSSQNTISHCRFWNCDDEGIVLLGSANDECRGNVITDCDFFTNCDGIELQYASENTIDRCRFSENTHAGIDVIGSSNNKNTISSCTFSNNNAFGLYLSGGTENQILSCSFSADIVMLVQAPDNTLIDCDIKTISLIDDSSVTVKNCSTLEESDIKTVHSTYTLSYDTPASLSDEPTFEKITYKTLIHKLLDRIALLKTLWMQLRTSSL